MGIQVNLSESLEEVVHLNQNTLFAYALSKGHNSGIAECINLELLGNMRGMNNWLKWQYLLNRYYH